LLSFFIFNIVYDTSVFLSKIHCIQLAKYYLFFAYIGARPIEIVDNKRSKPKNGSWEELYSLKTIQGEEKDDNDKIEDKNARLFEKLFCQETFGRGRPKALYYEDILLIIIYDSEIEEDISVIVIKFIH
jgi:hypothetical protein